MSRLPWVRFAVVAVLVALDLWTKQAVFDWLDSGELDSLVRDSHGHDRYPLVGGWLALMTSENPGAAFGRFGDFPRVLVIGRIVAVLVLIVALYRTRRENWHVLTGVVLVLAGATGNLYDNLVRTPPEGRPFGFVRDFIDVYFGVWDYHFPTFNVADSCITVGAVCFLLHGLLSKGEPEGEARAEGEGVPEGEPDPAPDPS